MLKSSQLTSPSREDCVLRDLLKRNAREYPDKVFVRFEDGSEWTYQEAVRRTEAVAGALQALGVGKGDHVLSWQPNGEEALLAWFGSNFIGAVYVPMNIAYQGNLLEHVVNLSQARVAIVHAELMPRLLDINTPFLTDVLVTNGPPPQHQTDLNCFSFDEQLAAAEFEEVSEPIDPWDPAYIIFTSGTTGPSKAVLSSYTQIWVMAHGAANSFLEGPDSRSLVSLPMFHIGGTSLVYAAILYGASIALIESFRTELFWDTIRDTGATSCVLLGVMATFLLKQSASPEDRNHSLKTALLVPWTAEADQFSERFGVRLYSMFNMTEMSIPIVSDFGSMPVGSAGKQRPGFELRLVDEHDIEVADGEVGELIVRTDIPWALNSGYYNHPEATAKAWRNGWFHTGDALRKDEHGYFYFVDRCKDSMRRRGENISSFEVESEVICHEAVREVAAFGVPGEFGEDDVMICVAFKEEAAADPEALFRYLEPRMPHYMLPRYIRVLDALPRTATEKVQKHILREQGITEGAWDREKEGITIKRVKLSHNASN